MRSEEEMRRKEERMQALEDARWRAIDDMKRRAIDDLKWDIIEAEKRAMIEEELRHDLYDAYWQDRDASRQDLDDADWEEMLEGLSPGEDYRKDLWGEISDGKEGDSKDDSEEIALQHYKDSSSYIPSLRESGEHSFHRRAIAHNYHAPFIYHIILKKERNCPRFGVVKGDARIKFGNPDCAYIEESDLGRIVAKAVIHLPHRFPILKLHQFSVMPDHLHILLEMTDWSELHLDYYIDALRKEISSRFSADTGKMVSDTEIFQPGYCDRPLLRGISLDGWYNYIRMNPHRLAMRMQYPQFFQRVRRLNIGDKEYDAYGNLFLFRNPDKDWVKISRAFSDAEKAEKMKTWLAEASTGTVLVSPFISQAEKKIRRKAEELGGSIILITHEAFPELFKPAAHDFELCTSGKLLIISLGETPNSELTRSSCMRMNALAEEITKFS